MPINHLFLPKASLLDNQGDLILTGTFRLADSGHPPPQALMTVKYSNSGVPLWTNTYSGPLNSDRGVGIVAAPDGNVVVLGSSWLVVNSPGVPPQFETVALGYSSDGTPLWTDQLGTFSSGRSRVQIASNGNFFVLTPDRDDLGNGQFLTVAYSSQGDSIWTNVFGAPPVFLGSPLLTLDDQGNSFVAEAIDDSNGGRDILTIRSAAPDGAPELKFEWLSGLLVLSWSAADYVLQSAPSITGNFTNVPGATSPYTNALSGAQRFFRLVH